MNTEALSGWKRIRGLRAARAMGAVGVFLAVAAGACHRDEAKRDELRYGWNVHVPLVIVEKVLDGRGAVLGPDPEDQPQPIEGEVGLIPVLFEYRWKGKTYPIGLADPILVRSGTAIVSELAAPFEKVSQRLWGFLALSPGHFPDTFLGGFLPLRVQTFDGNQYLLHALLELPDHQWRQVAALLLADFGRGRIATKARGEPMPTLDEALESGSLLRWPVVTPIPVVQSSADLLCVLALPPGVTVDVCMTAEGMAQVRRLLRTDPAGPGEVESGAAEAGAREGR